MATKYPISIIADDGITELTGEAEFPDPGRSPVASTGMEEITGNAVNIADGSLDSLTWDTVGGGDTLVDISVPATPTFLADGVYAVEATILPDNLTAGGYYQATLGVGNAISLITSSPAAVAAKLNPVMTVVGIAKVAKGDPLSLVVANGDGASARNFQIFQGAIVRLA